MAGARTFDNPLRDTQRSRRGNRAFIVEAIVLFVVLIAALTIVSQLFFASANRATQSLELEQAVTMASNVAERFSANPLDRNLDAQNGDLQTSCQVTPQRMEGGTLYHATITVSGLDGEVYRLETARYVSEVG